MEKWGEDFGLHPVGTGPFKFSEWIQGDRLVLSRNENYWRSDSSGNRLPYLDGMEIKEINDLTMQWTEFNLGNFEAIEVVDDPYYHEALEKYPDSFFRRPMMGTYFYGMNVTAKPFDNKKVRQAINYAIDQAGRNRPAPERARHSRQGAFCRRECSAIIRTLRVIPTTRPRQNSFSRRRGTQRG
ncbi:MAG: ABC transporter substrate-binding protein [Clostridia bacterium]